jgi:cation/acetate symporter
LAATAAVCMTGYFGINPLGFVVVTVALAFGLAASSFFPAILLGIFSKRVNKEGVICGMLVGVCLMIFYMLKFKFGWFGGGTKANWWLGISPEGFGCIAMIFNCLVTLIVSHFTQKPNQKIQQLVEKIREP